MFSSPGADGQQERGLEQQDSRGRCGIWCVGGRAVTLLRDLKKSRNQKKKSQPKRKGTESSLSRIQMTTLPRRKQNVTTPS